jgi:Druantia protein DruA
MEQNPSNISELDGRVIPLEPDLPNRQTEFRAFCKLLTRLMRAADGSTRSRALQQAREEIESMGGIVPAQPDVALKFACSVIVDVVAQGWEFVGIGEQIQLRSPQTQGISPQELKQRIREGHLLERDAQLREPSVREFIATMEQRRLGPRGWVSIFSLMRDGRELAAQLGAAAEAKDQAAKLAKLAAFVSPYLQLVEADKLCEHTGLKLNDIWRYFRHTWVSTYKSLPGRNMMLLVRDAAAPNHPVIGIAALGSSMAQQSLRDQWIGWDADTFETSIVARPTTRFAKWLDDSVERLIASIYLADLLNDGVIERSEIKKPSGAAIARLEREAARASEEHRRFPGVADHKRGGGQIDWRKQASTALFRAKRAKTLALLLAIRANLIKAGFSKPTGDCLRKLVASGTGRNVLRQLIRLVKAEHVGVDMMDIIVCGAVAPYNHLLGGKLVCLLLASAEVIQFYRDRYKQQESVIASSTKGQAVTRPPNLVLLATTSLYGVGSSQYNRIRIPLEELGGRIGHRIEYQELGASKGFGSYQFSQATVDYVETLLGRAGDGRKVNSIFGEGVNPLMRKIRDGLDIVGLPADALLRHGNRRVVYVVPLAENFRDVLLGFSAKPKYLLPLSSVAKQTGKLASYWRQRWLAKRIDRPETLAAVSKHSLTYPVSHGARVILRNDERVDGELFVYA